MRAAGLLALWSKGAKRSSSPAASVVVQLAIQPIKHVSAQAQSALNEFSRSRVIPFRFEQAKEIVRVPHIERGNRVSDEDRGAHR